MSTGMSTKRSFGVVERGVSKPVYLGAVHFALAALVAGVLLLVIGAQASVDILMIIGFFFAASAGLALNAMFWGSYYEKHGVPRLSSRTRNFD